VFYPAIYPSKNKGSARTFFVSWVFKTYALILRHFVAGVLAQPTRVACSVPEDCPNMGEYCNEETGTCDPGR
jgi:hypothetical protein